MNNPRHHHDLVTPKVTTGPLSASRKVYVAPSRARSCACRCARSRSMRRSGEPPLPVYDTTGVYTDPDVTIDVEKGLARTRLEWVKERGGVEEYDGRPIQPVDNGNVTGKHLARNFPNTPKPWRATSPLLLPPCGRVRAKRAGGVERANRPAPIPSPRGRNGCGSGRKDSTPSPNSNGRAPASSPRR